MSVLDSLRVPLMCAPMAGGPSTPQLAAAVTSAGGLGSIAGGYLTVDAFEQLIAQTRDLCDVFNVNLFVPEAHTPQQGDLEKYAHALTEAFGETVEVPQFSDDHFDEKVDVLVANAPSVASFTFGLPSANIIERVKAAGTEVGVTVTQAHEATASVEAGADFLIVQSTEAGGHLSVHNQAEEVEPTPLPKLVQQIREAVPVPLVAAGGLGTVREAQHALDAGACAVSLGTRFLTTDEAGTKPTHADALVNGLFRSTVQTRAFSGRVARGLENTFIQRMDAHTVVGYPQVHYMTSPIRKSHANDASMLNLWAGTGFTHCMAQAAQDVVQEFSALRVDPTRR